MSDGALPSQKLRKLIAAEAIKNASLANVRPASLDLTISQEVYRVEHLFLPRVGEKVRAILPHIGAEQHHLSMPMEKGVTYLARLNESFALPNTTYGACNPKSTTGRNDIHVRIIADGNARYDELAPAGFAGEVWVAIVPRSFPVRMHADTPLAQARLFTRDTRLSMQEMEMQFTKDPLLFSEHGIPLPFDTLGANKDGLLTLTVDLSSEIVGYECLSPQAVLDINERSPQRMQTYFRSIPKGKDSLIMREGSFYIISSHEFVRVPPELACEMRSMDDRYGDFRTHYAGFIDPGWGWGRAGEGKGRQLTLEVRPFENLVVRHGQPIALIGFEKMAEVPDMIYDAIGSTYVKQVGPQLAKQFIA